MHASPHSDPLAVRRLRLAGGGKTLGAAMLVLGLSFHAACSPPAPWRCAGDRRARHGGELLGARRLDRHQHRPHDDVRRSRAEPRLFGHRRAARARRRRTSTTRSRSARRTHFTTAYNDAAGRPSEGSAGTELAGQTFTPGVRTASSSLLLSSGRVTLDAQGDPNAVFIFQIGSTLMTGSNTTVR